MTENGNFIGLHRLPDRRRGDPSGGLDQATRPGSAVSQWPGPTEGQADERKTKALLLEESGAILGSLRSTMLLFCFANSRTH